MDKVKCSDCVFFATQDSGYSNWTVEETMCGCLKNKNPALPALQSYRWETELSRKLSVECDSFREGKEFQINMDVEFEYYEDLSEYSKDQEVLEILKSKIGEKKWDFKGLF